MYQLLSGAILMGYWVIGLFFMRFWKKTKDRFFAILSASFWLLGIERIVLFMTNTTNEIRTYVYLIRLVSFILIILAIVEKNRKSKDESQEHNP